MIKDLVVYLLRSMAHTHDEIDGKHIDVVAGKDHTQAMAISSSFVHT